MIYEKVNGELVALADEKTVRAAIARGERLIRTTSRGDILLAPSEEAAIRSEWAASDAAKDQQRLSEDRRRLVQEKREAALEATLARAADDPVVSEYLGLKQERAGSG